MVWFIIIHYSSEIDAVSAYAYPQSALKTFLHKFWKFSKAYGEYQVLPPGRRRQFLIDKKQNEKPAEDDLESYLFNASKQDSRLFY
ncbi:hypothetical protein D0962_05195 [Leptolyngbyaceae cyanobacterium CCMR0082]|uniref:Uncharacterized protein n=2 Tax=Adonisia turfae TaxID=2950184 RepID=A0A6M0S131_9CYAN|nr:hypothetical protein [Adonisia turfae]NEZ54369.1 hypothetical protein [Adonisia turfae CCMR0081]NEZ62177.1 hypothetical protein [Adonisia turfae CCMR0082]